MGPLFALEFCQRCGNDSINQTRVLEWGRGGGERGNCSKTLRFLGRIHIKIHCEIHLVLLQEPNPDLPKSLSDDFLVLVILL